MSKKRIMVGLGILALLLLLAAVLFGDRLSQMAFEKKYSLVYENRPLGYMFGTDRYMKVDSSKEEIFTKFENEDLEVVIYYDDFTDADDITVKNYDGYGNDGVRNSKIFKVEDEYSIKVQGKTSLVLKYSRDKIENLENDKNYYTTVSIPKTEEEVYTVAIKSKKENVALDEILKGFKLVKKDGEVNKHKADSHIEDRKFNEATREFVDKYLLDPNHQSFGVYEPTIETPSTKAVSFTGLDSLEGKLDYEFPVILSYSTTTVFEDGFGELKQKFFAQAKENGKVPELTFSTFEGGPDIASQKDRTIDILTGKYDDVLLQYAEGFKEFGLPVLFRINNEMNGDWVSYSTYHLGKDPDLFIASYRYIHDFFESHGVDNLIYVFNPNEKSFPAFSYNHYLAYYPGDEYVDVVGLTAYNTGDYYEGEVWRTFDEAYADLYADYSERFNQPFMITEFSSSSIGGDKVKWFNDMFKAIKGYDKIKFAVLWNGTDWDVKDGEKIPARQYRIDENEDVIEAVKNGLQNFK